MNVTIQNIPFFCLFWIGMGLIFIIFGLFMVTSHVEARDHYIKFSNNKLSNDYNKEVGELFSYFLEEEEKKNQGLREMLSGAISERDLEKSKSYSSNVTVDNNRAHLSDLTHQSMALNDIIKLYEEGMGTEEIAKKLKKGVGEVNLMISLYTMR